jgi:5'-3' exonuclease
VDNGMPEGSLADETVWLDLDTISERSSVMQRNYLRSSTSLSQAAFETCAALCETLGVPVLWTGSGVKGEGRPHEAEAMASMLVRHGYADIVASEDSDVILYDVPLLRGIMGNKTLEIVDSSMLRRRLFPPNVSDDRTTPGKSGQNIPGSADNHTGDEDGLTGTLIDFAQAECVQRAEEDSKRQMLDFALLCGTDFNRTLPGIAAGRALKLIQQYGSIDGIRRASVQLTQSNTSTPNSSDTDKARISRKSSLLDTVAAGGALRPPDNLTWREYSKELTQARQVFENPPTLFWQLRKVRDLRREVTDADCTESSTSPSVVQDLIDKSIKQRDTGLQVMTKGIGSAGRKKRTAKVNATSSNLDSTGFGSTPFGDDKAIATWQ